MRGSLKLSDIPSEMILSALEDLSLCEADPKFVINMNEWYHRWSDGQCEVCFAGSVIACSESKEKVKIHCSPWNFGPKTSSKLKALNYFRTGDVRHALMELNLQWQDWLNIPITNYARNRQEWRKDMMSIVKKLQARGL